MRTFLRLGVLTLLATAIAVVGGDGTALAATNGKPLPVVLHLNFRALGGAGVTTDGRYVDIAPPAGPGTLIDEQTGARSSVPPGLAAFSGHYIWWPATTWQYGSQPVIHRYALATGQEQTIDLKDCSGPPECAVSLGDDWLTETFSPYHVTPYSYYEDLTTGDWWDLGAPTGTTPTTVWDFDARSFTRTLCRPLQNTDTNRLVVDPSGLFDVTGASMNSFAVAYVGPPNATGRPYLERCGSRVRHRLAGPVQTANGNALLLYAPSAERSVTGMFLPSLQPLRITFPAAMTTPTPTVRNGGVAGLLLSSRTLYVTGSDGRLWAATFPERPPPSRR